MPQPDELHSGLENVPVLARTIAKAVFVVAVATAFFFGSVLHASVAAIIASVCLLSFGTAVFVFLILATIYTKDLEHDVELNGPLSKQPNPEEFPFLQQEDYVHLQEQVNEMEQRHRVRPPAALPPVGVREGEGKRVLAELDA